MWQGAKGTPCSHLHHQLAMQQHPPPPTPACCPCPRSERRPSDTSIQQLMANLKAVHRARLRPSDLPRALLMHVRAGGGGAAWQPCCCSWVHLGALALPSLVHRHAASPPAPSARSLPAPARAAVSPELYGRQQPDDGRHPWVLTGVIPTCALQPRRHALHPRPRCGGAPPWAGVMRCCARCVALLPSVLLDVDRC